VKFLCDQCKAKYQIADEKAAGKTVRMKCRKCGHLIEVRAAVTESNVGSVPPPAGAPARPSAPGTTPGLAPQGSAPYRGGPQPAPPRAAPLATSLASAKPAARDRSGALAGAFKSNVQRDDETSAPIDMSDLSPNDEWYVAINGVPVGPIRIAEIRRKAALGGVTEESLAWQEGLDEWRQVRSFPELAAIVREAIASGRGSLAPAAPGRGSIPPPPRAPARPTPASPPRAPLPPPRSPLAPPPGAAARSNVVPITSRLATAEKFESAEPLVVPDPFASPLLAPSPVATPAPPPGDRVAPASPMSLAAPIPLATDPRSRRGTPWIPIAMVAASAAFGITLALVVFLRPAPAPVPVVVQVPGAPVPAAPTAPVVATAAATDSSQPPVAPAPTRVAMAPRAAAASPASPPAAAPPAPTRGPLDLHSLTQNQTAVAPTDDLPGDAPRAPGQCFSAGQVQQFVSNHLSAIQRVCWERNPTNRPAVNVNVNFTVDPDGSVQGVSAAGDEPSIAKCIENEVHAWHFPGMGCSQKMNVPFHFVRQ
jgi:predicted Zn finger-like uncharacterized protein